MYQASKDLEFKYFIMSAPTLSEREGPRKSDQSGIQAAHANLSDHTYL